MSNLPANSPLLGLAPHEAGCAKSLGRDSLFVFAEKCLQKKVQAKKSNIMNLCCLLIAVTSNTCST